MRRPSVYELWQQAGGETPAEYDRDRFTALMREHGHITAASGGGAAEGLPRGRRDDDGEAPPP